VPAATIASRPERPDPGDRDTGARATWVVGLLAALAGLIAAAFALGVGEFVAGLFRNVQSPRDAVGSEFIDRTPAWLKNFAVDQFGTNDKVALRVGMLIVIGLLGLLFGALSFRRPWIGALGFAGFGIAGAVIAVRRPDGRALDALPPLVAGVAGIVALLVLVELLRAPRTVLEVRDARDDGWVERLRARLVTTERKAAVDRRSFFIASATVAVGAVAAGGAGRWLRSRFAASESRAKVVLPRPQVPALADPPGETVAVKGMTPFVTPNGDFYRIDTALAVPQVTAESWRLKVHGRVDNPLELTFAELLRRPVIEREVTLTCVSNEVGGHLVGNAKWLGVSLADLLREAQVHPDADQLKSTSHDGFTAGTPVRTVMDGRDALLAFGMNGQPLPLEHGFPVRMVIPGLYGYVSATKWVVDLELTRFDDFDAYWVHRGWSQQAPIKTQSRIDVPKPLARVAAGTVAVAGVAWAQHRGIKAVEVRFDGRPWHPAQLAPVPSADTWRQWTYAWDATPGRHTIEVRATDATGAVQPEVRVPPIPDGATGWHSVDVEVA
jgi:DMSO/TMAO reductase YedYZ molybdopterin-dependent catalytic subunit